MKPRKATWPALLIAILAPWFISAQPPAVAGSLPEQLTDTAFWTLSQELSEPNGFFQSDNLLSNEIWMQYVIPELLTRAQPRRVYLGVGPEQNFTYIAALKPSMVFIVDVRRGNMHLHLMYKALFEMSADRADFLSRLFSRKRPDGLTTRSSAAELFGAYAQVPSSEALYLQNLKAVREHLVTTRGIPLGAEDLGGVEYVMHAFYSHGPGIHYNANRGGGFGRRMPDYVELMLSTDEQGTNRAYLASEESFQFLKQLHSRNLLVPVVGNFGGDKALRAVGRYIREGGSTVAAFYLSNVEQYLGQQGLLETFCGNVAALPLDAHSTFIRSVRRGRGMTYNGGRFPGLINELGSMQEETKNCR